MKRFLRVKSPYRNYKKVENYWLLFFHRSQIWHGKYERLKFLTTFTLFCLLVWKINRGLGAKMPQQIKLRGHKKTSSRLNQVYFDCGD